MVTLEKTRQKVWREFEAVRGAPCKYHMQINDYRALAEFRYQLRRFLRFSEESARQAALEPQQHQLLLAITGMPEGEPVTVNALAERMQLRQNSVVELVDRCANRGLVARGRAAHDRREVVVSLTRPATLILRNISRQNRQELEKRGPLLLKSLKRVVGSRSRRLKKNGHRTAKKKGRA